ARRHGPRAVRQGGPRPQGVQQHPPDGLPQPERALRRGDHRVPRPEDHPQADAAADGGAGGEAVMKRLLNIVVAVSSLALGVSLFAQSVPEINYDASADVISLPSFGEVAGVATNSKGHVFVYARTGHAVATLGD